MEEAKVQPYPGVFVETDGTVHEVDSTDRAYLETVFDAGEAGFKFHEQPERTMVMERPGMPNLTFKFATMAEVRTCDRPA